MIISSRPIFQTTFCALITAFAPFLAGQATCPALNLLTTPRIVAPMPQTIFTVRQNDGSFAGYFGQMVAPYNYNAPMPNFQNLITSCTPAPTKKGSAPFSSYNRAGWSSHLGDLADLDGDGIEDVVVVAYGPPQLFIALISSSGHQKSGFPVGIALPAQPLSVRAIDINKDGKPDLIVSTADNASTAGAIYVLLNNGTGSFGAATRYPAGAEPLGFAVIDVNGDGNLDLVVADQGGVGGSGAGVAVLFGNGAGGFSSASNFATPGPAKSVVVGDFNGDKILDIAAATGPVITVFPGNGTNGVGNGTYGTRVTFPSGGDSSYLAMGDFNADGKLDLVSSNYNEQTASVFLNSGSGTTISFQPQVSYVISRGRSVDFLTVTDFNNDGIPDIIGGYSSPNSPLFVIAGNSNNVLDVLLGNGDGTFGPFPVPPITQVGNSSPIAFAVAGDFNGDGKMDVAAMSQGSTSLLFYAGHGDGSFAAPVTSALGGAFSNATGAIAADFNGDGVADLAIVTNSGFAIALNQKNGSFQALNTMYKSALTTTSLAVGDFNADGKLDVATAVCSTTGGPTAIHVYTGNGAGGFTDTQPATLNYCPDELLTADFNGDKKPDLVSLNNSVVTASADILLNQGTGSFAPPRSYGFGLEGRALLTLLDANGDGNPDLVAASNLDSPFAIATLLNNGDGTFGRPVSTIIPMPALAIAGADLNGDKKGDLILSPNPAIKAGGTFDLTFAVGNGDGSFQMPVHLAGPNTTNLQFADFNGDGRPDLLATSVNNAAGVSTFDPNKVVATNAPIGYFMTILTGTPTAPPPPATLSLVNGASFTASAPVAAESIASAFGSHLAVSANASGTTVAVQDSTGTSRSGTIFFASSAQVNFQMPPGTANGAATVTVTASDGTSTSGTVQVANVAPGMFAANSGGLYAGSVLVVSADGTQTPLNNYQLDANQNVIPLPVSLSPASNQVFLIMYGTGIRHATSVTATVGGQNVQVAFAGAQGAFIGEDQVNIGPLPQSLAGNGVTNIVITADGQAANTVNLAIQ
jgi:uncharacterized protein (TIGR03437 family)